MKPTENMPIVRRFSDAQDRLVVQASDLSLGTLAEMVDSEIIDTTPEYQRRERWSPAKQSALIESFLLNIPVPPVYLAEDEYGKYSVVDGKQRLTAICGFIKNKFRLTALETFNDVEGLLFNELPAQIKNALLVRPYLRIITLLKQSDPLLKYEVFVRLNRGGESMEPQELRNVAFRGPLNDLIYELSETAFLKKQLKIKDTTSSAYRSMLDAELVVRFFTLRENWQTFTGGLRTGMDAFMTKHAHSPSKDLGKLRKRFLRALSGCEAMWGTAAFRRPTDDGEWRDQFLNGMFDAQMLAADELTDTELNRAISSKKLVLRKTRDLFKDKKFEESVRQATNTPSRIEFRVNSIHQMLVNL